MNWKNIALFIVSLATGFSMGVLIKFAWEASVFRPYSWEQAPVLINCYGDEFSELQMIRAIDFWTMNGHRIAFYEHKPPKSVCKEKYLEGFIIIRKASSRELKDSTLASTKRYSSFDKMEGAVIVYKPGSHNLLWINEHELGHALGYSHVEIEGHIMHPLYHKMGGKFWIP